MKYMILAAALALSSCSLVQKQEEKPAGPPPHLAGWQYECHKVAELDGFNYCVHKKGTPKKVVWFFHGAGCNQDVLQDTGTCISIPGSPKDGSSEKEFMTKLNDAAVVTMSFGPIWLADPEQPTKENGTADRDATVTNITAQMRAIGQAYGLEGLPYHAMGHSMGGFNALMLAMKAKGLKSLVLIHPFIPTCDVFSREIINEDCPADMLLNFLPPLTEPQFTKKRWKEIDPLVLGKKFNPYAERVLVLACDNDVFGLYEGPKRWAQQAMQSWPVYLAERMGAPDSCHFEWDDVDRILRFQDGGL